MLRRIRENWILIFMLSICTLLTLIYLSDATANVPVMDYWKYITHLVDDHFTYGTSFYDLWYYNGNNSIHHAPIQLALFLVNVRLFHHNTQIAMYCSAFLLCLCALIICKRFEALYKESSVFYKGCLSAIVLVCFCWNSYEILTLEFGFSFAMKMLFFFLSFILTDIYLENIADMKKNTCILACLYTFVITCIAAGYFVTYGAALSGIIIWDFFRKSNKEKREYFLSYCTLGFGMLAGVIIYFQNFSNMGSVKTSESIGIIKTIGEVLLSYVYAFGGMIMGPESSGKMIVVGGTIFALVQIFVIAVYFIQKQYRKTYLPMMLIAYVVILICELYVGRGRTHGVQYLSSSRYCFDYNWIIVGDLWIVNQSLSENIEKKGQFCKGLRYAFVALVIGSVLFVNAVEWKKAPYRKVYFNNLVDKVMHVDELSDEELLPFQDDAVSVREGIKIMKKYKLGVFHYSDNG